ncbi:MAG: DegV family protein [Bacillota bacterium]|nr:DegV family protein [Bacillota bacterium]
MAKVKIICDSASDIRCDVAEKLGVKVVPLLFTFDGETYLKDGADMSKEEFFDKMRKEGIIPKTSQITAPDWEEAFIEALPECDSIVCITISSAASGTCQSANIAKADVLDKYPDADITILDSMSLSFPYGIAIECAAKLAAVGADKDAVIAEFERVMSKVECFFLVEDLKFLKKGGRINLATLIAANLMDIKPVLTIKDGLVAGCDKIRGGKNLYEKFMKLYINRGHILSGKDIYIIHSLESENLNEFCNAAEEAFHPASITPVMLGATIGSHAGPGLSAVVYVKD